MRNLLLALSVLLLLANSSLAASTVNGAGASFPYPVYSAWAFQYQKDTGTKINYQSIGSGGGVRQISNRTVDFGASDAPVKPADLKVKGLLQFPAIIGGVVPIINVKGVDGGQLKLTGELLSRIFLGKINKWNDPEITELNPGQKLPDADITVIHRSDGSGTTAIFTSYLSEVSKKWKEIVGAGKLVNWPVGIGGKGNEGVTNYVKRVKNSIGYVEFAYAKRNKLTDISLQNRAGRYVDASFDSFKAAAAGAKWEQDKGYYLWLVNAPGNESWPIAGASFILLATDKAASNQQAIKFYDWAFNNGDEMAVKLVYVPLPQNLKEDIRSYWKASGL
ncbi:MAG: phosphate ABC transporter substrate-binding protein PstS [Desulfobacteraceae bacterium 4572_35.1]|nr:MAG: phosphate ABC transporter substrate-binding protein PstS [Desulfobacteraceae bacterium 4572_35.1]